MVKRMKYPAGMTVLMKTDGVPVSIIDLIDTLRNWVLKLGNNPISDSIEIAPPRRRPSIAPPNRKAKNGEEYQNVTLLKFVIDHPGQYCTKEVALKHPNFNASTVKTALYALRRKGILDRTGNRNGKWFKV